MKSLHFIAPLWNVHGAIDGVVLRHGLQVQRRKARAVFKILKALDDLGEAHEQEFAGEPGTSPGGGQIFVVTGRLPRREVDPESFEDVTNEWRRQTAFAERFEQQFHLMRLFREGTIYYPGWYFYRLEDREVVMESCRISLPRPQGDPYRLSAAEARALNKFLQNTAVPLRHDYLDLAFEHFLQSYEVADNRLSFLSLMIAAEVLFNDGRGELSYRLARGMAVLLGATEEEAWMIFRKIKKLYDKRSGLVHSGLAKNLVLADTLSLRELLRKALKTALSLGVPKDALVERLTANGFGCLKGHRKPHPSSASRG